jgi:hypothetical protein
MAFLDIKNHMSSGAADKTWTTCIDILKEKIYRLPEVKIKHFKRSKNGSVLPNESKYIRRNIKSKQNNKIIPNKHNTVY